MTEVAVHSKYYSSHAKGNFYSTRVRWRLLRHRQQEKQYSSKTAGLIILTQSSTNFSYVSGLLSLKNCHTLLTSSIMSKSKSATSNSSLCSEACAKICPRGSTK